MKYLATGGWSLVKTIYGEFRRPRQMLGIQEYEGHLSIHDDKMAEDLGFSGAPIEGPTHFSQFVPLLYRVFGNSWFERGCISAHYQNMVTEGEEVRAFVDAVANGAPITRIGAEKRDGTSVLVGTASVGPDYGKTEIQQRLARLRSPDQLVILRDLAVGQKGAGNPEAVGMDFGQHMGQQPPPSPPPLLPPSTSGAGAAGTHAAVGGASSAAASPSPLTRCRRRGRPHGHRCTEPAC